MQFELPLSENQLLGFFRHQMAGITEADDQARQLELVAGNLAIITRRLKQEWEAEARREGMNDALSAIVSKSVGRSQASKPDLPTPVVKTLQRREEKKHNDARAPRRSLEQFIGGPAFGPFSKRRFERIIRAYFDAHPNSPGPQAVSDGTTYYFYVKTAAEPKSYEIWDSKPLSPQP